MKQTKNCTYLVQTQPVRITDGPEACLVLGEVPGEVEAVGATQHDVGADRLEGLAEHREGVLGPQGVDGDHALDRELALVVGLSAVCGGEG